MSLQPGQALLGTPVDVVFLGVKAYEYKAKFAHEILPGYVFDRLDGPRGAAATVLQ